MKKELDYYVELNRTYRKYLDIYRHALEDIFVLVEGKKETKNAPNITEICRKALSKVPAID